MSHPSQLRTSHVVRCPARHRIAPVGHAAFTGLWIGYDGSLGSLQSSVRWNKSSEREPARLQKCAERANEPRRNVESAALDQ